MPKDNPIPEKYRCSITSQIMIDPVIAADGHTYEREAIEEWLQTHDTSPKTNIKLKHKELTDNHYVRCDILEFLDIHPELYDGNEVYLPKPWIAGCIMAIKQNQLQVVQRWLDKDKRLLTLKLEDDSTALHLACEFGSPELVDNLLKNLKQKNESIQPGAIGFKSIHLNVLLEKALNSGDYAKCELLLKLGAEVEQPEASTQNTLLHRMVVEGAPEAVSWLLDQKAILESRNSEGNTPLLLAVIRRNRNLTEFLLKKNANPQVKNVQKKPIFYIAVENGDIEIAKLLLAQGANPALSCGAAQLSTLHIAVESGNVEMLKYLLQTRAVALIDLQNAKGDTPLHLAVQAENEGIISLLLGAGAYHEIKNEQDQTPVELAVARQKQKIANFIIKIAQTTRDFKEAKLKEEESLHQVVEKQATEISNLKAALQIERQGLKTQISDKQTMQAKIKLLELLIKVGADFNKQDNEGKTPVYIVAETGHVEAIDALHAAGANMDEPDNDGATPVWIAACNGHAEAIAALHAAGADVDAPDNDGKTPVFTAAENGNVEAIAELYAADADMDAPDNEDRTPVFIAAENGHAEAIAELDAAGADLDMPAGDRTPVYIAAHKGYSKVIATLKAGGADVDTARENGDRPIGIAALHGHSEAITALLDAGADASIKTKMGTALDLAGKGKKSRHREVVELLEAHLKQYPNGIKPIGIMSAEVFFPAKPFTLPEQKNPMLSQFQRFIEPNPKVNPSELTQTIVVREKL